MAHVRKRASATGETYWQVRWRQDGDYKVEKFSTEAKAVKFRGLVDANGQRYPEGWVPKAGFVKVEQEEDAGPTLREWYERSIASRARANAQTKNQYRGYLRDHVPEWLAQKPIDAITREDVGRWLSELQERRAGKTVRNVQGALSSVMKDAMTDGLVQRNPFAGQARSVTVRHEEMVFLTPEEFRTFIGFVPEHYQPMVTLMFGTGLRWAEITALQVKHIDFERSRLMVVQAWKRQPDATFKIGEPKSPKARRPVSLTPRQLAIVKQLCDGRAPDDYVITNSLGGVLSHSGFYHGAWETTLKRAKAAGFPKRPRIHDMRHSHAALLISRGRPLLAVSRRLGHSSIMVTNDRYGHLLPEVDEGMLTDLDGEGF